MANLRQFSLSYLFLEVFWIAVALMFTTPVIRQEPAWQLSAIIAFSCWGAVIGGFFHAMRERRDCSLFAVRSDLGIVRSHQPAVSATNALPLEPPRHQRDVLPAEAKAVAEGDVAFASRAALGM